VESTVLLLPFALAVATLWLAYRSAEREAALVVSGPTERATLRLRQRLTRGEISAEEYDRLIALMR